MQLLFVVVPPSDTQTQKLKCVVNQLTLDFVVEGRVCSKTGTMVYLKENRFALRVKHYVESQHFEAQTVLKIIRLAGLVGMTQGWLGAQQSLDDDGFDLRPESLNIFLSLLT